MELFGVIVSEPGEEERHFLVLAESENGARRAVNERVDFESVSLTVVPGMSLLAEHDGCAELWD